eukprot:CAMPEP_0116846202 /NCGR_PEP_ID=MMETSP0418-20121206/13701_1 /TAXON_ID=1158023 /ORGANISM="Astrosyne radiata, Strain 13vi08-1A" /LENGTH=150 /DNA_ID=CAMNT_0004477417 /DNA_START=61 /DNA_END=513 /DNA_ORIENTATION=+
MKLPIVAVASLIASAVAFTPRSVSLHSFGRVGGVLMTSPPSASLLVRHMSSLPPADFVKSEIESGDVVIFSKSFCPFCKKTKKLMKKLQITPTVIELDDVDGGAEMQDALAEMTGQKTVPNVFIKGQHLGGNDATQAAAKSGKLQEMLGI